MSCCLQLWQYTIEQLKLPRSPIKISPEANRQHCSVWSNGLHNMVKTECSYDDTIYHQNAICSSHCLGVMIQWPRTFKLLNSLCITAIYDITVQHKRPFHMTAGTVQIHHSLACPLPLAWDPRLLNTRVSKLAFYSHHPSHIARITFINCLSATSHSSSIVKTWL